MDTITKAVFPIAGLGTRTLPASLTIPKEMFPLVDKPIIQILVEQAVQAGVKDTIMVTGRSKRALEDHFDRNVELYDILTRKGKQKELAAVEKIWNLTNLVFARQAEPLGDGHALLQAQRWVDKTESVYVLFGDTICHNPGGKSSLEQMKIIYEATNSPVVLVSKVPDNMLNKFGVAKYEQNRFGLKLTDFVEKPKTKEEAPSNLVAVGQYIVTPGLMQMLGDTKPGPDGEIRLANTLKDYTEMGHPVYLCEMEGRWLDTGDKLGYIEAFITYALMHPEIAEDARILIAKMMSE